MNNRFLAGLISVCLCAAGAIGQQSYTIEAVTIGNRWLPSYAMNNSGVIVGTYVVSERNHAFIWQNGVMTDLGEGVAYGINNSGQIAGGKYVGNSLKVCVWSLDGQAQILDDYDGVATTINNVGQIAGNLLKTGGFTGDLSTPNLYTLLDMYPVAMNDSGDVVGEQYNSNGDHQACLWRNGQLITNLGNFPDGYNNNAVGINSAGQVAISLTGIGGIIWQDGNVESFGYCDPFAINNKGQTVGFFYNDSPEAREAYGFLRELDGTVYNLNDLIPSNSGWWLDCGYCINDVGQIFGLGMLNGERQLFLMTPVPEPGMMVLLGLGAMMVKKSQVASHKTQKGRKINFCEGAV